ncbi:MAG: hypothetical protein ABEJ02_04680 [Candidatus Paceibacteria bacterium]
MPQHNREFIEYNTLNLPQQKEDIDNIDQQIKKYTSKIDNEPVELVGRCSMELLLRLFLEFRKYATELVFRACDQNDGLVIFSILDEKEYQRAGNIERLPPINEEQYNKVKQNRNKTKKKSWILRNCGGNPIKTWNSLNTAFGGLTSSRWKS